MAPRHQTGTWIGVGLIASGAYLPWVAKNPFASPDELLYRPGGLDPGFEIWGFLLIPLAALACLGLLFHIPWINTGIFRGFVGVTALVLATSFLVEWGVTGYFIAGIGVYLTVIGGIMLGISELVRMTGSTLPKSLHTLISEQFV